MAYSARSPDAADTQLAAVVENFNEPYKIKKIALPGKPEGHDLLIKVLAASYCHTDAVFAAGGLSQDLPRVGCHEFAGTIVALGPDVPTGKGLAIGTRVGVPGRAYHPCGLCYECVNNGADEECYSTYCPRAGNLGLTRDGGFQEYCLVDGRQVVPLPDSLPATQAAPMMCAGLTIWAALQHEKIRSAAKIAILGAGGGLGHLGVQFAAHLGMEVLAVDVADQAISLLKHIRSDLGEAGKLVTVVDAQRSPPDHIKALAQGDNPASAPTTELGVDAVLMLPASQSALDLGLSILRNHGTMMVLSFPKDKLRINASDLVFRDINFVGSLVGRNHHLREMIEFAATHQIKAEVKPLRFIDINAMVDESRKGFAGKLVIDMTL